MLGQKYVLTCFEETEFWVLLDQVQYGPGDWHQHVTDTMHDAVDGDVVCARDRRAVRRHQLKGDNSALLPIIKEKNCSSTFNDNHIRLIGAFIYAFLWFIEKYQ